MRTGIDILEYNEIKDLEKFIERISLEKEKEYIYMYKCIDGQTQRVSALWCVKEAVFKALGLGKDSGVTMKDVELCHEESGRPYVKLYNTAMQRFKEMGLNEIEISLSHTKTSAIAICIVK